MKILSKKPKEYVCIFTIAVVTKKEGDFFIFFALDAYLQYVITFEVMPDNSQRDYQDFIKLVSNKENIDGVTIQQFIINNKIERVKELIQYEELNLTEISYKFHYSSISHLSNQFKKVTGCSPSCYKKDHQARTLTLENI